MDESFTMLKCFLRYAHVFAVQTGHAALANAAISLVGFSPSLSPSIRSCVKNSQRASLSSTA